MTDRSFARDHGHDPEKYARLIRAAAREFAQVGFAESGIDAIAADAGVAKGTVYLYFENKRSLFHGVLEDLRGRLFAIVDDLPASSPRDAIQVFVDRQILLADAEPDLFRCYTSALFGVNREFLETASTIFSGQIERLRPILGRPGERAAAARRRARFVVASTLALALARHLDGSPRTTPRGEADFIASGALGGAA